MKLERCSWVTVWPKQTAHRVIKSIVVATDVQQSLELVNICADRFAMCSSRTWNILTVFHYITKCTFIVFIVVILINIRVRYDQVMHKALIRLSSHFVCNIYHTSVCVSYFRFVLQGFIMHGCDVLPRLSKWTLHSTLSSPFAQAGRQSVCCHAHGGITIQ